YETDTEPGSSGSPVLSDAWDVVALHHSSVPRTDAKGNLLDVDGKVWVNDRDDPDRLDWVGNEGIRVSSLVEFIRQAKLGSSAQEELRKALLEKVPLHPMELLRREKIKPPPPTPAGNGNVTVFIPLQVTVSLGAGTLPKAGPDQQPGQPVG